MDRDPTLPLPGPDGETSGELAQQFAELECTRVGHTFGPDGVCAFCGAKEQEPAKTENPVSAGIKTAHDIIEAGASEEVAANWLWRNRPNDFGSAEEAKEALRTI